MAITVSTSVSPTTASTNQVATLTVAVTNNGGATVNVTNIVPTAIKTGGTAGPGQQPPVNFGSAPVGTGLAVAVAASTTVNFPIGLVAYVGTTGPIGGGSGSLTLGAQVYTNDGQSVAASTCTLTVNNLQSTYAAAEQTSAQPVCYP